MYFSTTAYNYSSNGYESGESGYVADSSNESDAFIDGEEEGYTGIGPVHAESVRSYQDTSQRGLRPEHEVSLAESGDLPEVGFEDFMPRLGAGNMNDSGGVVEETKSEIISEENIGIEFPAAQGHAVYEGETWWQALEQKASLWIPKGLQETQVVSILSGIKQNHSYHQLIEHVPVSLSAEEKRTLIRAVFHHNFVKQLHKEWGHQPNSVEEVSITGIDGQQEIVLIGYQHGMVRPAKATREALESRNDISDGKAFIEENLLFTSVSGDYLSEMCEISSPIRFRISNVHNKFKYLMDQGLEVERSPFGKGYLPISVNDHKVCKEGKLTHRPLKTWLAEKFIPIKNALGIPKRYHPENIPAEQTLSLIQKKWLPTKLEFESLYTAGAEGFVEEGTDPFKAFYRSFYMAGFLVAAAKEANVPIKFYCGRGHLKQIDMIIRNQHHLPACGQPFFDQGARDFQEYLEQQVASDVERNVWKTSYTLTDVTNQEYAEFLMDFFQSMGDLFGECEAIFADDHVKLEEIMLAIKPGQRISEALARHLYSSDQIYESEIGTEASMKSIPADTSREEISLRLTNAAKIAKKLDFNELIESLKVMIEPDIVGHLDDEMVRSFLNRAENMLLDETHESNLKAFMESLSVAFKHHLKLQKSNLREVAANRVRRHKPGGSREDRSYAPLLLGKSHFPNISRQFRYRDIERVADQLIQLSQLLDQFNQHLGIARMLAPALQEV